uniref:MutS-like protein n=1 Tax=Panagrolaimus sp. ES5 TaxID=591445 RepID=A0AC34G7X3_9BILA
MLTPQGLPSYDINEANFSQLALKSVGGFVIVLAEWGDIYYVSENIDQYLGFCQRMEIRGKFLHLNALASPSEDVVPAKDKSKFISSPYALAAICT